MTGGASYRKGENPWTPEAIRRATQLWNQGLTKAQVGDAMGVSRQAIIGLFGRLRRKGLDIPRRACMCGRAYRDRG